MRGPNFVFLSLVYTGWHKLPTLGLYLKLGLYMIPVYSVFGLDWSIKIERMDTRRKIDDYIFAQNLLGYINILAYLYLPTYPNMYFHVTTIIILFGLSNTAVYAYFYFNIAKMFYMFVCALHIVLCFCFVYLLLSSFSGLSIFECPFSIL